MEDRKTGRQKLGKEGEDLACEMLVKQGHVIFQRNWRSGHLEIDIVSVAPDGIHFVEVKTRRDSVQAPPQEQVNALKQRKIVAAAKCFLHRVKNLPPNCDECFFDVVAITFLPQGPKVEYFPQAYIPIY